MLGWHIYVYKRSEVSLERIDPTSVPVASWSCGVHGASWIDALVAEGRAADLGGNGYPFRYELDASTLLEVLSHGLPRHDSREVIGDDYHLPLGWSGEGEIDLERARSLPPGERLLVEVWDGS